MISTSTVSEQLVDWAWSLAHDQPPLSVREAAARQLLDALGCAVAGARSGEVAFVSAVADELGGAAEAQRLDGGPDTSAPVAALVNGALLHALDLDDTHAASLVHVSAAVVPATLAVAQQVGASGAQLLDAVIIGNEVVTRLGAAVPHGFHARGFHPTSVCGVFASALSACWLLELEAPAAVAALGIAGSQAAGSLEFLASPASTKQLHPGLSGHAAVLAARLAAAGATGPRTSIEGGRGGLFHSYLGVEVDPAALVAGLGSRWETEALAVKCYPCCHLSHASIDAARSLLDTGFAAERVSAITVTVHPDAVDIVAEPADSKAHPTSPYGAKFSLPWCVAEALLRGDIGVASFEPERIERPDVLAMARRVTCRPAIPTPPVPAASFAGSVSVTFADGTVTTGAAPGGRGGPGLGLSDDERIARFIDASGAADASAADDVARSVLRIGEADAAGLRRIIGRMAALPAHPQEGR